MIAGSLTVGITAGVHSAAGADGVSHTADAEGSQARRGARRDDALTMAVLTKPVEIRDATSRAISADTRIARQPRPCRSF